MLVTLGTHLGRAVGTGWGNADAHLRIRQLSEVGRDVEEDPLLGPRKRYSTEEQDDEHDVGVCGREVDHLEAKDHRAAPLCSTRSVPPPPGPLHPWISSLVGCPPFRSPSTESVVLAITSPAPFLSATLCPFSSQVYEASACLWPSKEEDTQFWEGRHSPTPVPSRGHAPCLEFSVKLRAGLRLTVILQPHPSECLGYRSEL